jgi:hypothetical protein
VINEQLDNCLRNLTDSGMREMLLLQSDDAVQDYWNQRNEILQKMTDEIQSSIIQIRNKYEQTLFEIEQDYAMYLSMITPIKKEQD